MFFNITLTNIYITFFFHKIIFQFYIKKIVSQTILSFQFNMHVKYLN